MATTHNIQCPSCGAALTVVADDAGVDVTATERANKADTDVETPSEDQTADDVITDGGQEP